MRSALCRLSYRAATRTSPDHREPAHKCSHAPGRVALALRLGDGRQNLRHNNVYDLRLPISNCRLAIAKRARVVGIAIRQSQIPFGGPRGSRTHYLSIKSRELILMSLRPSRFRIADLLALRIPDPHSAIINPQFFMLRPRVELGSRTDLVLRGYKPRALPIELPELLNLKSQMISNLK